MVQNVGLLPNKWCNILHAGPYRKQYYIDGNICKYQQYDIVCHHNTAYGSTKVVPKSEIQLLCLLLCEDNDMGKMQWHHL